MSRYLPLLLSASCSASLVLGACSSVPNGLGRSEEVSQWVPGVYEFEGYIRVGGDTYRREGSEERRRIEGEVTVGAGGPTSLETGLCAGVRPTAEPATQGREINAFVFTCGESHVTLWPSDGEVRGTMSMMIKETLRTREACVSYVPRTGECASYNYNTTIRYVRREATLRARLVR